jgi:hypothetical protein
MKQQSKTLQIDITQQRGRRGWAKKESVSLVIKIFLFTMMMFFAQSVWLIH